MEVEVEIHDLAYGGMGVGRLDKFVIFVNGAMPGERVRARVFKRKKNHGQAKLIEVLKPSPKRIEARCHLFETCGGCSWQHMPYEEQLGWKQKQVAETLARLSGLELPELEPILASPETWRYRNKMEYSFGYNNDRERVLGFHVPGRFDRIFAVDQCQIHPEAFDSMLGILDAYASEHELSGYDPRTHEGFLRHAVMRHSRTTDECILVLLTATGELPEKEALVERLAAEVKGFKGFVWGTNDAVADVARIEREQWSWGEPQLIETVNGLTFTISPQSFFQTNTSGAQLLYAKTAEMAQLDAYPGGALVLDAFCGAGSIGLHMAHQARHVVGVEIVKEAIWDARANAKRNNIGNTTFIASPMGKGLELARAAAGGDFTHVIIDPPRGGMDKRSLKGLIALQAPHFVYVSCNPATLARDLQALDEGGYAVDAIQPVDMFPHTYHIEVITRLSLKS